MKSMHYLFLLFLLPCLSYSQVIPIVERATLPSILNESSGIGVNNRNKIWSNNDSGGNPEIYGFDSSGTLTRTITLSNATNVDWEEMTKNSDGNYFIGDFGNNSNNRKNLKVYKIPNPDSITGNSVNAQAISFTYADQSAFPPAGNKLHFDMEGFVAFNHSLYLFSKNRTSPYDGYTKLYKLPDTAGTYVAELMDSIYLGPGGLGVHSVTAAALNPSHTALVLLTYGHLYLFTNFSGDNFLQGTMQAFTLGGASTQKEAICFTSDTELYLTDEKNSSTDGKLYECDLSAYIPKITATDETTRAKLNIYPNPGTDTFIIEAENLAGDIHVFNLAGQQVLTVKSAGSDKQVLSLKGYPKGEYVLQMTVNGKRVSRNILLE